MKIAELRAKSKEELKDLVLSLKKEQFNLRMQAATGALEGQGRFRDARRTIARAKTLLGESAVAAKPAPKAKKEKPAAPKKAAAKKVKKEKE
jgi:large subunit ribosomal protein L29